MRDRGHAGVELAMAVAVLILPVALVVLGTLIGQIEGKVLELCYKIANLLVRPLFLVRSVLVLRPSRA